MPAPLRQAMDDQIKRMVEMSEERRTQIREYLKGQQLGQRRPTDEEVLGFVDEMQAKYPPVQMVSPDGRPVFASPWFVYLGLIDDDNANELVTRYVRITAGGVA